MKECALPPYPYVDRLAAILGEPDPPPQPIDWTAVENLIGLPLPYDYKELFRRYSTVDLDHGFIAVMSPLIEAEGPFAGHCIIEQEAEAYIDDARYLREEFPESAPYPLFPEPHGVYPWACTKNNDVFWWRTIGDPDDWTVIVQARDAGGPLEDDWWETQCSASELLAKLMNRELICPVLPDWFPR